MIMIELSTQEVIQPVAHLQPLNKLVLLRIDSGKPLLLTNPPPAGERV